MQVHCGGLLQHGHPVWLNWLFRPVVDFICIVFLDSSPPAINSVLVASGSLNSNSPATKYWSYCAVHCSSGETGGIYGTAIGVI